jgi:hypothetical protein
MPVPAGSRQARHLNAKNQSDVAETNFCDQSLKAKAAFDGRARSLRDKRSNYLLRCLLAVDLLVQDETGRRNR